MKVELLPLSSTAYHPNALHARDRAWTETNCYVDVWIEVLHALGADPLAACAFTLSTGFEGDQWTFFKFPPEDLRFLFGVEVSEMYLWQPLIDHVVTQLSCGRLMTIEVDAWYLPDTVGTAYRRSHEKTTIVPQMIHPGSRRLGYFHGGGYFELDGNDFDGVFRIGLDDSYLPPYVELIKLDRFRPTDSGLTKRVVKTVRDHLSRRPIANPMVKLAKRLEADQEWLVEQDLQTFHVYAFAMCRQCGAAAGLASSFVEWLNRHDGDGLERPIERFGRVSETAKGLQFALARVTQGRRVDISGPLRDMDQAWGEGLAALESRYCLASP